MQICPCDMHALLLRKSPGKVLTSQWHRDWNCTQLQLIEHTETEATNSMFIVWSTVAKNCSSEIFFYVAALWTQTKLHVIHVWFGMMSCWWRTLNAFGLHSIACLYFGEPCCPNKPVMLIVYIVWRFIWIIHRRHLQMKLECILSIRTGGSLDVTSIAHVSR